MTDRIGLVYAKLKLKFWNLSDYVWSVMKTRQDNDMTNHIGAVYTKNEIEWLLQINQLGAVVMKTRQDNDVTEQTGSIYAENNIKLL